MYLIKLAVLTTTTVSDTPKGSLFCRLQWELCPDWFEPHYKTVTLELEGMRHREQRLAGIQGSLGHGNQGQHRKELDAGRLLLQMIWKTRVEQVVRS